MGIHKKERELAELKEHYIKKSSAIILIVIAFVVGAFAASQITLLYTSQRPRVAAAPAAAPQQTAVPEPHTANPEALANLESQAAMDPTNADKWIKLGNFCFDHDLPTKAIIAYKKGLELAPTRVNVWSDLGVMYRRTEQYKEAVDAFAHAASLDKTHLTSRFNMGIVYLHDLNDKESALKIWKEVLSIDPNAKTPTGQNLAELVKGLE